MAQPRRRAQFFVTPDGVVIPKAPPIKPAERRRIFERDEGLCQWCGVEVDWRKHWLWPYHGNSPAQVDHILARSRGGQNTDDNLTLACTRCNASRGAA